AAGMHFAGGRRPVRQIGLFHDRQGVHVGAQTNNPPTTVGGRFASADHSDDPGAADAGSHLIAAESLQFFGYDSGGAVNIEQQFRVGMKIATPSGDLRLQTGDAVGNRHG